MILSERASPSRSLVGGVRSSEPDTLGCSEGDLKPPWLKHRGTLNQRKACRPTHSGASEAPGAPHVILGPSAAPPPSDMADVILN
ncbi:hypothetical protein EYF80_042988 [Liparis tanakae]|uniref:Uncharacterized protein n=1 Tax=Liparis tanakae TaxID=230148 RepID=A0A4Z2FZS7_9TELE|nr:hypothetical protein EYF80_042988 [Liparis tanakae]